YDFFVADDTQPQRQGKNETWLGIEAFRGVKGQLRAAQHALETAHQVVMTDQTQIAAFTESYSNCVACHCGEVMNGEWVAEVVRLRPKVALPEVSRLRLPTHHSPSWHGPAERKVEQRQRRITPKR